MKKYIDFFLKKRENTISMAQAVSSISENQESAIEAAPQANLVVYQPQKLESLLGTLDLIDKISERIGEDKSGDWSGSGTGNGAQQGDDDSQISARDKAIAALPKEQIMRRKVEKQLKKEAKQLERQIFKIRNTRKVGAATKLNDLYAQLRKTYGLLNEILEASYEVLKRLYIRVFIDKQPILQTA